MYALNLAEDGRILSASFENEYTPETMPRVEALPEGDKNDYRYVDGQFILDPRPEPEPPEPAKTNEERIAALEDELAAAKILLGVK